MKLTCFETVELSDIGRKRKNNEDACVRIPEKGVYCVADGMGGAVGGDLASAAIVKGLKKVFIETTPTEPETFAGNVGLFRQAANAANKWIREFADENVIGQMGSTLVAIVFDPDNPRQAVGLHAGDSRLYRFRDGELKLLTADHTAAAALAAQLGRDSAKIPEKFHNELVKAVGLADRVELEKTMVDVDSGDMYLLCSDGLTRMMPEEAITKALKDTQGAPLDKVAQTLIAGANEAGGKDNVTVVLIRMGDLSGYNANYDPVNLDDPDAPDGAEASDGESITMTRPGSTRTSDSADSMHGFTPHTEEGGSMRGDTPNTPDHSDPPTPPTVQPRPSPKPTEQKKPEAAPAAKPASRTGPLVGVVLVVLAIAGVCYHFFAGSRSFKSAGQEQTQQAPTAPSTAPAPAAPLVTTEALPPPPPAKKEPAPAPAPPATADVLVQSDPAGAEVWLDGQSKGKTPVHLNLPAGQTKLTLKAAGLPDQIATVDSATAGANETKVVFPYGGVVIQSSPAGADVLQNGTLVGHTPFTAAMLAPGPASWQLQASGCQPTNVSVEIADHQTQQVNVQLQREKGVLRLTGNLAGVVASVDGAGAGRLPMDVWVEVGVDHTVTAKYKGMEQILSARAITGRTRTVAFTFHDEPPPPRRWTNDFIGTVFVEVPDAGVWAAATRVTEDQFKRVMGSAPNEARENEDNSQRYVVNLTSAMATGFAAKLTDAAKGAGGLPEEIKNYHFALPTPDQWVKMFANSDKLGLHMTNLKSDKEWCLNGNAWNMAGYVLQGTNFNPTPGFKPINPGADPKPFAIRLVLAP